MTQNERNTPGVPGETWRPLTRSYSCLFSRRFCVLAQFFPLFFFSAWSSLFVLHAFANSPVSSQDDALVYFYCLSNHDFEK